MTMKMLQLAAIGVCIGVLAGLSVSPVMPVILATLMTLAASVVAVLSGIEQTTEKTPDSLDEKGGSEQASDETQAVEATEISKVMGAQNQSAMRTMTLAPLTSLVLALLIGSLLGLTVRLTASDVLPFQPAVKGNFEPPEQLEQHLDKWERLGIDRGVAAGKIFDTHIGYAPIQIGSAAEDSDNSNAIGLHSVSSSECERWSQLPGSELAQALRNAGSQKVGRIPELTQDAELLRLIVKIACDQG